MDLLALLANVYFAVDELARELKDKSKGYNPILHEQQFEKLTQTICSQSHLPFAHQSQQLQQEPAIPPRFCRINA
jgi:3-methyladenine DNA glycosylase/8-oxoguanine DNA glycosylase